MRHFSGVYLCGPAVCDPSHGFRRVRLETTTIKEIVECPECREIISKSLTEGTEQEDPRTSQQTSRLCKDQDGH